METAKNVISTWEIQSLKLGLIAVCCSTPKQAVAVKTISVIKKL